MATSTKTAYQAASDGVACEEVIAFLAIIDIAPIAAKNMLGRSGNHLTQISQASEGESVSVT